MSLYLMSCVVTYTGF